MVSSSEGSVESWPGSDLAENGCNSRTRWGTESYHDCGHNLGARSFIAHVIAESPDRMRIIVSVLCIVDNQEGAKR